MNIEWAVLEPTRQTCNFVVIHIAELLAPNLKGVAFEVMQKLLCMVPNLLNTDHEW